jgi:hypothetical protein
MRLSRLSVARRLSEPIDGVAVPGGRAYWQAGHGAKGA